MSRQMAQQMIKQYKDTRKQQAQSVAHPVDLDSLDELERPLFNVLDIWFSQLRSGVEAYTPDRFVDTIKGTVLRALSSEVEIAITGVWEHISKVNVPQNVYTQLVTNALTEVYEEYLPILGTEIGRNAKPERFTQARAYGIANTEITALRALVQIVLIGTYNDLVEMSSRGQ